MRKENTKHSAWVIFSRILTAVLVIATLFIVGGMAIAKKRGEVFFFGDRTVVFVLSESMEPTISARSFIVVEKVNPDEVEVGDIIMFRSNDPYIKGQFNTHEVIGISSDRSVFYTKGQNNAAKDPFPPGASDIRARYVKNADMLNAFISFFLTKTGLIVTLCCILVLCLCTYLPGVITALCAGDGVQNEEKDALIREKIREEVLRLQKEKEAAAKESEETAADPATENAKTKADGACHPGDPDS